MISDFSRIILLNNRMSIASDYRILVKNISISEFYTEKMAKSGMMYFNV